MGEQRVMCNWRSAGRCLACLLWVSVAAVPGGAFAQSPGSDGPQPSGEAQITAGSGADAALQPSDVRARDLYLRGDRLYGQGDYEGALVAFREAYALSSRPLLLYNIHNALERAGRYVEALEALNQYVPHADREEHAAILRRVAVLEQRVAELRAQADSRTASRVRLEQRAQQAERAMQEVAQRKRARERARELERERLLAARAARMDSQVLPDWAPFAALGVGGAALSGGVALSLLSSAAGRSASEDCLPGSGGGLVCSGTAASHVDRERGLALGADLAYGFGAVSVALGLWWLLDGEPEDEAEASSGAGLRWAVVHRAGGGLLMVEAPLAP